MSTNKPKGKRYKCPYCEYRGYRVDLVEHVDEKHEDMIPKDYSSSRVVYNAINKKEHGSCMICHKETEWDENKQRYNTLCGSKKCKDEYVKIVRSRMVKKYGTDNLLRDPNFQKKMLENRSISGKYKFEDGGVVGYVGSYEKKFLEFMDKFLHIKSYDIISPGPTIPYHYNGKEHLWITDFIYEPYNLVFDVKDGGDNPNTRDMKEYREKQTAKEKAIAEYGDYNYIRLTDNKFEQLISIFMELKEKADDKPIIRINESFLMEDSIFNEASILYKTTEFHLTTNAYTLPVYISQKKVIKETIRQSKSNKEAIENLKKLKTKFKGVKTWRMNHGNIVPVLDKKFKEVVFNDSLRAIDKEIEKLEGSVNESFLTEGISRKVIDDFEYKEEKQLSSFTNMGLSSSFTHIYAKNYPFLSEIPINNKTKGCVWLDSNKDIVALINTEEKEDGTIWIERFILFEKYRGYGLSKQILKYAVQKFGITHISVKKEDETAYDLYRKLGFKTYKRTEESYFLRNISESFFMEVMENNIEYLGAYHLEPKMDKKPQAGGWDEELYSKDIRSAIINDIKDRHNLKWYTSVEAYVYTAGKDLKPICLGIISIPDKNNPEVWEWVKKEKLSNEDYEKLTHNPMEAYMMEAKNDKGEEVPKVCPKCGSKIGVFLRGEPVFLCTNKECNKYFGTAPFNESYIEELGALEVTFLGFFIAFYGYIGYTELKEYIDKKVEEKAYHYKISDRKLSSIPKTGHVRIQDAIVYHAYFDLDIRKSEKNTLIYTSKNKSKLDKNVYLYKYNKNKLVLVDEGKFSDLCDKYNVNVKSMDESLLKDREKAYRIAVDVAKKEISKYPELKKHATIGENNKNYYSGYLNGQYDYVGIVSCNVWDVIPNARSNEGMELAEEKIWKPAEEMVRTLNDKLPKDFVIEIDGDWDDLILSLYHKTGIKEETNNIQDDPTDGFLSDVEII